MAVPRSNRRDFLKGKAAAQALENLADQITVDLGDSSPDLPLSSELEHYLVKFSRRAMACQFEIWLNAGQFEEGTAKAIEALDLVDQLEEQLTVYRDTSEISRLNQTALAGPVTIEFRLFQLILRAVELSRMTSGAFDITAGPLSELWGFKRRTGRLPEASAITEVLCRVGSQFLELNANQQSVRFLQPGIEINLGAIGKGYALDRCAELLAPAGITDFLLHGGNSSVLARGCHAATPERGWLVGVRDPLRPQRRLGQLLLRDRALATSGSGTQFFVKNDRRFGHILDPRSGWPAEGVLTATVLAPTAAEADALSTACYVLGPSATEALCSQQPQYACLMICPGTLSGSLVVHRFGITDEDWNPSE